MTDDDQLRRLLSDAVSDIEPQDRLAQIRDSVRSDPKVVPMSRPRSWMAVVGVAAAVAVIGGVAFAAGALQGNNDAGSGPAGPGPTSHHTTAPVTPPTSSTGNPTMSTSPPATAAVAVYYVGHDGSGRPVLFREFHQGLPLNGDAAAQQAVDALATRPVDPDYSSAWPAGALSHVALNGDTIDVTLADGSLHDRPAGMSGAEAKAAIQQVIYTAQAAYQRRAPVQFLLGGNPVDQVLGVPTSEPLTQGKVLTTLSLMNLSNPSEGAHVNRGTLVVDGVNNGFEGTVVLKLMRGNQVVLQKAGIGGFGPDKLYPWKITLDTSKVPAGQYTLVASNDNPSGQGTPATDTRTIFLK